MPFYIGLIAAISLQVARLSQREQVAGLTGQEQINKCREMEVEARMLASSQSPEKREGHLRLANRCADLATELARNYYFLLR